MMPAATQACLIGALAVSLFAQDRPGIDRPIRVGSFIGTGPSYFWVENTHHADTALATILANPGSAGLGQDLIIPSQGFTYTKFGINAGSRTPTAAETESFINALDTLDVVYIGSFTGLGSVITSSQHRDRLRTFMTTKAYVGVNRVTDSHSSWPTLDSINGARYNGFNHPRNATLRRDSVAESSPDWKYLNQGLFLNGLDTTIMDQWYFWTQSGEKIREGNSLGSMVITVKVLEESMQGGLGGAYPMGDHPMSWGRRMAAGGRVFYTSVGHRVEHYLGGPNNPRFLRRQIYNAILWTMKYDSLSQTTGVLPNRWDEGEVSSRYRIEIAPSTVKVNWLGERIHNPELLSIDGRHSARREGKGAASGDYVFENLQTGVYVLAVTSRQGRFTRVVAVP